ncbi:MAG: AAA family ATPase [Candidatus Omnitrophica bacterium]|nr:AAA family ATPase [Candidatus Omnitrophota bacterium]MBU4303761.1 AAA family ATPase [Candidatus Omnitrophota bacterium]MBU4468569.1 AAA family ATPase [Candidatus Omnitrophota bacterium]MCG2708641.1 AAA family ATPase [Candidatus Omnitrophota bacterium]
MKNISRILNLRLPAHQSAFLWGARKTGKSTYLKERFPDSIVYDFLKTDLFLGMSKNPSLLREQLLAKEPSALKKPIILDEVQKVPQVLDEVHWLIENKGLRFVLCGSSARKLKKGHANLLGGRAWRYELFPLVSREIARFDLLRALNHGLIPFHYLQSGLDYKKSLEAYVQDYLRQEVFAEGLTRNIPAFSRFFDAFGYSHGEITNYCNIARECGVDSKTVKEYYQILIDTLLAIRVEPFKKRQSRQVITKASKYYMFDVGVAGYLTKRHLVEEKGAEFGRAFEHFLLMEMVAYRSYAGKDFTINFWRTKSGLEVDFILGQGEVAIEIKGAGRIDRKDMNGLEAFIQACSPKRSILVCNEKEKRLHGKIEILPWEIFLHELWDGKIVI